MSLKRVFQYSILLFGSFVWMSGARAQNNDTIKHSPPDFPIEATVAVNNHYYLPATVLTHKKQLGLTAAQLKTLAGIAATLEMKKKETSISSARNEHMLDSLFHTNKVNEGVIIFYTNRYGLYEGEYRGAVLLACYNTHKVLTLQQLNKLIGLENHN